MPIMLVGDASWRGEIALANNDLAFEVITPSHMLEVKTYPNKWAEEQAAREFSNRTQTEWDACIANARSRRASQSSRNAIAAAMANLPPFATVNQMPADSGIAPRGSAFKRLGITYQRDRSDTVLWMKLRQRFR